MISTRDLSGLPDIDDLKRLMQSMAMLDAILSPQWEYRYYSFNSKWASGEQMGSMRNGSGDDLFALFTSHGCFLKGFAHEVPMTPYARRTRKVWRGVLDSVPAIFEGGLREPAAMMEDTTFCIWRRYGDICWRVGNIKYPNSHPDPDGSQYLLSPYDGKPNTYWKWAREYFDLRDTGKKLMLTHVRHVYAHKPLTAALVKAINSTTTLAQLKGDINEIGYPHSR
jgi:hypothetical protein